MNNPIEKEFPEVVTLTVTSQCNLRCRMCAQWSEEGYMLKKTTDSYSGTLLPFDRFLKVVDEVHKYGASLIIRGGEPLLYPRFVELLTYIKSKKIRLTIETNGVLLKKYAEQLVNLKVDNLNISLDGPEKIHDFVRGANGTFSTIRQGLQEIEKYEKRYHYKIHCGITYTISGYNYLGLSAMPDVARSLRLNNICIIPYCFIPEKQGLAYEKLMKEELSCAAYSWKGFHHEESGVDIDLFLAQLKEFKSKLEDVSSYPYMALTDSEYRQWFTESDTIVYQTGCNNINGLLDVQPDGDVNFCIDFPDYSIGNAAENSLHNIWNSERARKFRSIRMKKEMPVCYRCASRYLV
jgi:MoaA/NifB/PqqE/SkfB family radical SAM enzyme